MADTVDRIKPSEKDKMSYRRLPLREQYATLMALGEPEDFAERYDRAMLDFNDLIRVPDLISVGINWDTAALVLGTEGITVLGIDEKLHFIGDLAILIMQRPARYTVTNLTRPMRLGLEANASHAAHPHAMQGAMFCMTEQDQVLVAIADGMCSVAARILMAAAWMRPGTVRAYTPYNHAGVASWPEVETKQ